METLDNEFTNISINWRPKKFCNVLGQDVVSTILKNSAKSKKLCTAYMLSGTRGCGKTSLARLFAKALNCHNQHDGEPCGLCQNCMEIHKGISLSVLEIDAASNRGIDDIRNLTETCGYATAGGFYKVYIVDEAHMLTNEAFNALLKTLEEPPKNVIFILATTDIHKIPPTVKSRCMNLCMNNIKDDAIISKLSQICDKNKKNISHSILSKIAYKADGSMRDAESMLQQVVCFISEDTMPDHLVNNVLGIASVETLMKLDNAIIDENKQEAIQISSELLSCCSNVTELILQIVDHYKYHSYLQASNDLSFLPSMYKKIEQLFAETNRRFNARVLSYIIKKSKQAIQIAYISPKVVFETLILEIMESKNYVSVEHAISSIMTNTMKQSITTPTKNKRNKKEDSKTENTSYFIATLLKASVSTKPIT